MNKHTFSVIAVLVAIVSRHPHRPIDGDPAARA